MREGFELIERMLFWTGRIYRADLRRELGVSEASASRLLTAYAKAYGGMKFQRGRGGGYVVTEDFRPYFYVPQAAHSPLPVISPQNLPASPAATTMMRISQAALARRCVEIDYVDSREQITSRTIQPVCWIAIQDNILALHAYCHLRQAHRTFDLSGIQSLRHSSVKWDDAHNASPELRLVRATLHGWQIELPQAALYPLVIWAMGQPAWRTQAMKDGINTSLKELLRKIS